jgi:acyl-coenzyme A synthetase/AMP-(fatty) acid ligase
VEFVTDFVLTSSGKINRRLLRDIETEKADR